MLGKVAFLLRKESSGCNRLLMGNCCGEYHDIFQNGHQCTLNFVKSDQWPLIKSEQRMACIALRLGSLLFMT